MVFGLVKVCFYEPIKKRQNIRFFPIPPPVCRNPWFTPCMQNAFLHALQKTWIHFENISNSFSIVSILQSNCFPHKTRYIVGIVFHANLCYKCLRLRHFFCDLSLFDSPFSASLLWKKTYLVLTEMYTFETYLLVRVPITLFLFQLTSIKLDFSKN